ncbi:MAG: 16S rRNA (cytosine(1402)-N(4))-methyltransferase RsmH [Candidatus Nealsonbacteria bacterium]|nr:16S rRNA (cytosine(1402)-N(4))-methyltransferase RsmH [Candidatus Nealsonbacteria bacterium]
MHIPVLKEEVIQYLDVKPNDNFIDATCGNGGHSAAILEKNGPKGKVLAIDRSPEQAENCKLKTKSYGARITTVCDNFANLADIAGRESFKNIKGILFDLGVSSWHLEESGRGFSFQKSEPLDMRFNPENQLTAQKILNFWSKPELTKMFKDYGEERFGERIAQEIVNSRQAKPITDTLQLVEVIRRAVPGFYKRQKIHFATKAFQALRVAVNQELANIEKVLPQALDILAAEGRMVVISFQSLEDRIAKNFFREKAKEGKLEILTKKPIIPSLREIKANPRARSAKLRAAIKK